MSGDALPPRPDLDPPRPDVTPRRKPEHGRRGFFVAALVLLTLGGGIVFALTVNKGGDVKHEVATGKTPGVSRCGPSVTPSGVATALPTAGECREIAAADLASLKQDYWTAANGYRMFARSHPESVLASYARSRWILTANESGPQLVKLGDFKSAIEIYQGLIDGFPGSPVAGAAAEKAGAAYLGWAAARESDTSNAFHWQDAVDDYRTVLEDYAGTDAAERARTSIDRLYQEAVRRLRPGLGCDPQDILRAITRDGFHTRDGGRLVPLAVYQCLSWEVGHGYADLAVDDIQGFLSTYPHDPLVPKVLLLRVKARQAAARERSS